MNALSKSDQADDEDTFTQNIISNLPNHSPWKLLASHLANQNSIAQLNELAQYLDLLNRAKNDPDIKNSDSFKALKASVMGQYASSANDDYWDGRESINAISKKQRLAFKILKNKRKALEKYLKPFNSQHHREQATKESLQRAIENLLTIHKEAVKLSEDINAGTHVWEKGISHEDLLKKFPGMEDIIDAFPNIVSETLLERADFLTGARRRTKDALEGNTSRSDLPSFMQEYADSMQRIFKNLENPDDRDEINLVDVYHYLETHEAAALLPGSIVEKYINEEASMYGLAHAMDTRETTRRSVDSVQQIVDPNFQHASHAFRLSRMNANLNLGLDERDVELFSGVTSLIANIMRGYGINEIDDRLKQILHNSGDHSLRVCITAAHVRDEKIKRIEFHFSDKTSDADLAEKERQIQLAQEECTFMAMKACTHDLGEYLGELLGNNLIDKNSQEERLLRTLRDHLENFIAGKDVALKSLDSLLKAGLFKDNWQDTDAAEYLEERLSSMPKSLNGMEAFESTKFYERSFDIHERVHTNQDINGLSKSGRNNEAGKHASRLYSISHNDKLYTTKYVLSKVTGFQFNEQEELKRAQYHQDVYKYELDMAEYEAACKTAKDTGAPLPHKPEITRPKVMDYTQGSLADFMMNNDITFEKSLYKTALEEIIKIKNNESMSVADKAIAYKNIELELSVLSDETIRLAKETARSVGEDVEKTEGAVRKMLGQNILKLQQGLKQEGLNLSYLEVPKTIHKHTTNRLWSTEYTARGINGADIPQQRLEPAQDGLKAALAIADGSKKLITEAGKVLTTPMTYLRMAEIDLFDEAELMNLYEEIKKFELAGDANISMIGILESGFDIGRQIALINPLITAAISKNKPYVEGVEKCYPHIMSKHGNKIREAMDFDRDDFKALQVRDFLKKGPYSRPEQDFTEGAKTAERMFAYFTHKYDPDAPQPKIFKFTHEEIKNFERAEIYMLQEMIVQRRKKAFDRADESIDPYEQKQQQDLQEKLNNLQGAPALSQKKSAHKFFNAVARHGSKARFAAIGGIGAAVCYENIGTTLASTPIGDIKSSAVLGFNMMLMGSSGFARELQTELQRLPKNHPIYKATQTWPRFERGEDGGVYIVKYSNDKNPNKIGEISSTSGTDFAKALIATSVHGVKDPELFRAAISNLDAAQWIDFLGLLAKTAANATPSGEEAAQAAFSLLAGVAFRTVGTQNAVLSEFEAMSQRGEVPDMTVATDRTKENLRKGCNLYFYTGLDKTYRDENGEMKNHFFGATLHGLSQLTLNKAVSPFVDDNTYFQLLFAQEQTAKWMGKVSRPVDQGASKMLGHVLIGQQGGKKALGFLSGIYKKCATGTGKPQNIALTIGDEKPVSPSSLDL